MALQFSNLVRSAMLDGIETVAGTSARLKIRTGSVPANCAAADSGTVLCDMTLPSDWMAGATNGVKTMSGTWQDAVADATGTAGHFRLYTSGGSTVVAQGTVTATGGGGDMELTTATITAGQPVTITTFTLTAGNA